MQNKPDVKNAKMNINPFMKSIYVKLDTWLSWKNKPNFKCHAGIVRGRYILIVKKELNIALSLSEILQILSIVLFEKVPIKMPASKVVVVKEVL